MRTKIKRMGIFLLIIFFSTPTLVLSAGSVKQPDDKIALSLRIARARKDTHKIEYYKSVVRQKKLRLSFSDSPPSAVR